MRIAGVDPGTFEAGVVLWDTEKEEVLYNKEVENSELCNTVFHQKAELVVIEMPSSYGNIVGIETFQTILTIGRLQEFCDRYGIRSCLLYRTTVRATLCHNSNAGDKNIARELKNRYGYWEHGKTGLGTKTHPGKLYGISGHAWQALGLIIAFTEVDPDKVMWDYPITRKLAAMKREEKKKKKQKAAARSSRAPKI